MRRCLLLPLLLWCAAAFAADDVFSHPRTAQQLHAVLSAPARDLVQAKTLRGRFTQKKFLRELPTPLPSDGDFLFARELGISWHTRHPLDSEFILTRRGMTQKDGGNVALHLTADKQPALQLALRLFVALFSLDMKALDADFKLYGRELGERWQLGLMPKNPAMAAVFEVALIEGSSAVERIELRDRNGDRTEILIVQLQSAGAVSAEDQQRFAD